MADDLRDRLARAVAQNDTLGGCQFNDYFCVTHMAYLGPSDLYCTRVTGIADALLLFIRTEVADTLERIARRWQFSDWADAPRDSDPVRERLGNAQYVTTWLLARAEEV